MVITLKGISITPPTDLLFGFGNMELWSGGVSAAPDWWALSGSGATVAQDATNVKVGTYAAALTRVGTDCKLSLDLVAKAWIHSSYVRNRVFTVGGWVRATVASRARLLIDDGVATQTSSYHTGGSAFEWLTVSLTAASAATKLDVQLQVNTGNTTAQFDGMVLVLGSTVQQT